MSKVRQSLQNIIDLLVTTRNVLFADEAPVNSKKEENHLKLNSVDLVYTEEKKKMKQIIKKLIQEKSLTDPIYDHEDECLELIRCFEDLYAERDEHTINEFIEILFSFYNDLNEDNIHSWKENIISVGSFLFTDFVLLHDNMNIQVANLRKFLSLSCIGHEPDYMKESFFYFETNHIYIVCKVGNPFLNHEYLVFLKNSKVNSEYISVIQKYGADKMAGNKPIYLNFSKKTRHLSSASGSGSDKSSKEKGFVSDSGTTSSSESDSETDDPTSSDSDSSDHEQHSNIVRRGMYYLDKNEYNETAAAIAIVLLVLIIIAYHARR